MSGKSKALILAGAAAAFAAAACKKDRGESFRQELQQSGYEVTTEAFFRAAESDDTAAMEQFLKAGIPVDARNPAGDTALHAAAAAGMLKSADFLLDRGLQVDVPGAEGRTPLMSAVLKGSPAMVRYLLSQKANPHHKEAKGYKPLMLAVRENRADMVAELAPYDRESLDTALLLASLEGKAPVIDELTSYGASVYARTDDGRSPLMLAAQNGQMEAVEMLLELGANRFSMDGEGRIAADMAREGGHEELALRLAEEPGRDEFGIEEPLDLGEEMVAQLEEMDSARLPAGESSPPPVDATAPPATRSEAAPVPLEGAVVAAAPPESPSGPGGRAAAGSFSTPLKMRAFRPKELPLRVESVEGDVASIRIAGGGVEEVPLGAAIPGSPLTIVRLERRMRAEKDSASGPVEVSVVEVEDTATGRRRELFAGLASTAHDPVALVEDASGTRYLARAGQRFRGGDATEYRVVDVRPNQMVIENCSSGEVITVPLRGPRG